MEQPRHGLVANVEGLNLDVGPRMDGKDRELLEEVCRCLLRGPLAHSRLKLRGDATELSDSGARPSRAVTLCPG